MDESKDLSVVFEAASSIEASVVQALLESHGIDVLVNPRTVGTVLPLKVDGIGHVRLSVRADQVVKAHQVITGYENALESEMSRQPDEFLHLESSLDYNFQDKGLLEDALTHRSRAHEDVTGGVSDNESLEFLGDAFYSQLTMID